MVGNTQARLREFLKVRISDVASAKKFQKAAANWKPDFRKSGMLKLFVAACIPYYEDSFGLQPPDSIPAAICWMAEHPMRGERFSRKRKLEDEKELRKAPSQARKEKYAHCNLVSHTAERCYKKHPDLRPARGQAPKTSFRGAGNKSTQP